MIKTFALILAAIFVQCGCTTKSQVEKTVNEQSTNSYVVEEAHCRLTFHAEWPLQVDRRSGAGSISQRIPDVANSAIFLHYGTESTIEKYIGAWKEKYGSKALVEHDEEIINNGLRGRYVRLSLDSMTTRKALSTTETGENVAPEPEVTPAQILVTIGYTIREVPLLVGYLLPRNADEYYFKEAERIIKSVKPAN